MEENKDTIKIEVKKSLIATLAFVALHLIVITGWGFSIFYVSAYPKVVFYEWYLGKPPHGGIYEYPDALTLENQKHRYSTTKLNVALMETATCLILTSLFTIILYLEYCRRLPKKE